MSLSRTDIMVVAGVAGGAVALWQLSTPNSTLRTALFGPPTKGAVPTAKDGTPNGEWTPVGTLSQMFIHPVKSGRGINVTEAVCTEWGLKNGENIDRHFMLVNPETKVMVTARDLPRAVLIQGSVKDDRLTLSNLLDGKEGESYGTVEVSLLKVRHEAERRARLATLWRGLKSEGLDCGDTVSKWLTHFLNAGRDKQIPVRLLHFAANRYNLRRINRDPKWIGITQEMALRDEPIAYPDLTPYTIHTQASLDELNTRMTFDQQVVMRQFRPNFVVVGDDIKAFDEDNWRRVKIGNDVVMTAVKPCGRCMQTTVNPTTGVFNANSEPLKTLRTYRLAPEPERKIMKTAPVFGKNLVIDQYGPVKTGDTVYVQYYKR